MTIGVGFWLLLFSAVAVVAIVGKRPERLFAFVLIIATSLTFAANSWLGLVPAYSTVIAIDIGVLAIAIFYVCNFDRQWPIWFAGFHIITVATEVGSILFPTSMPRLYIAASGVWALPALGSFALGVLLDQRSNAPVTTAFQSAGTGDFL